jgi:hypothetical protein
MASNDKKTPTTVPITVLPPGSGDQIDRVREWTRNEERNTADIMDHQTRKMGSDN